MQIPELFNLHLNLNTDAINQQYTQRSLNTKNWNMERTPSHTDRGNYYNSEIDRKFDHSNYKKEQQSFLSGYQTYKACKISEQNQKDLVNTLKPTLYYQQETNLQSSVILEQIIKKMNERITKTEQKIEKLKINEKSFVKRNEIKDLILIIKEQREENEQLNKKTNKQLEKIKQELKGLYENFEKNFVSKPEFDLKLQKWKLKEYLANSSQLKKTSSTDTNQQLFSKIQTIKQEIKSESDQIKEWCCNKITQIQTPNIQINSQYSFSMKLFRSNKLSQNFHSFEYQQIIKPKRALRETHQNHTNLFGNTAEKQNIFGVVTKQSEIVLHSCTYFIDDEGFLLDNDKCYILTQNSGQIKLSDDDLTILRKHNILEKTIQLQTTSI